MITFLWILLFYVVIPVLITGCIVSLIAGVLATLLGRRGKRFMPTAIRAFAGATVGGAIASAACLAFIGINAYVLNNLAYRGQGLGYALLLVPVAAVIGSALGGVLAPLLRR